MKWTLNFLKGTSAHRNTKVKISKKVWVGWKNDKYVFCSWKWDLSDGNNFSQQKLTFCCLQSQFYKKFAKKSLKIMIWVKGWGVLWILVFWPSYYFEMKFKVSFQLPVNLFYMLSTQFLSAWWNLTKSRFWPIFLTILCMKYSILQNRTSFVGSFLDQFTSSMIKVMLSKTKENHLTWKILLNSIFRPFL